MTAEYKLTNEQEAMLYDELKRVRQLVETAFSETAHFNEEVLQLTADDSGPKPLTPERLCFRVKACLEELEEVVNAYQRGDHGEVIDGFLDNAVFAHGAVLEQNVPAGKCFSDIIDANLQKKRGKLVKRPESGGNDAVKPEGWKPPNHDWVFQLSPVAIHMAKIHTTKDSDYGHWSLYFPYGSMSFVQVLHMKTQRLLNLVGKNPEDINHESELDSVLDLGNYVNFYAEWLMAPEKYPEVNKYGRK